MSLAADLWMGIGGEPDALGLLTAAPRPTGALPSSFQVERFGGAALATVGLAVAELTGAPSVTVDPAGVADALRSEQTLRIGDDPPEAVWDPLSRVYRAADGWVRLHGNYAQHRAAIEAVFGTAEPERVAAAIAALPAAEAELRVHGAGGVAAAANDLGDWALHPHGGHVRDLPLVQTTIKDDTAPRPWRPSPFRMSGGEQAQAGGLAALAALASEPADTRPLTGLRVLELTRVIAGPVAGRTLSWFGADVLRVESPDHHELRTVLVDTGPDKRSTLLDLRTTGGRDAFAELLSGADVLLHGLRPGALGELGFDAGVRARHSPGLIDASLSAYGPGGPWSGRRGFDSLTQLSSGLGLAEAEAAGTLSAGPRALPCQVLDHATGLLMAAAVIRAAGARAQDGRRRLVVGSLARTAAALDDAGRAPFDGAAPEPATPGTLALGGAYGWTQQTPLPITVEGVDGGWHHGAPAFGGSEPTWG